MAVANRSDWLVIGISGVTCGGKTTLARSLLRRLAPASVLHQDRYFYPDDSPRHVRCEGLEHNNYDTLGALDMAAMLRDAAATIEGDDKSHARAGASPDRRGRLRLDGKKFLIVEGFTVLNYKPLFDLCDLRYYFILEYSECFARRVLRLYDPPDVAGYFERCVWPEHVRYRAEVEKNPQVRLLDGTRGDALDIVLSDLEQRGASRLP